MTKFQIILISAFGFFIVVAVAVFALYKGGASSTEATVIVWGDLPSEYVDSVLSQTVATRVKGLNIKYVEKQGETLDTDFTEALARGTGPDVLITTQDKLWKEKSKLMLIPFQSVSENDFKNAFVEESELFLTSKGIYAMPVSIDPMVLYYNRDLLTAAGQAKPIEFWDELYTAAPKLTRRDGAGNVLQSAIALGETKNIPNYKDILSLLMIQAGTPITSMVGGELRSYLSNTFNQTVMPGESALDFYTQFSNQTKPFYTWNRNLASAQTNFTSGDAVYYLGFASEYLALRNKNPNLNFSIAQVPQSRVSGKAVTFGRLHAAAISRSAANPAAALQAVMNLASAPVATELSLKLLLPSARRDLLAARPTDAVMPVFFQSALQSKGWLDPDPVLTKSIFSDMIEAVTSGRARLYESVSAANQSLENLIKNN